MTTPRLPGLVTRAIIAILLLIGFYVFALTIAGILLYIAYLTGVHSPIVIYKLAFLCLAVACTILWSILPRIDRFSPPGHRLNPRDHRKLFTLIKDVARKTKQRMPREVYVTTGINAGVSERGGFLSIGSRRIMILGLPLLQVLSVAELRAVLAHEFGHYYSGDTKLATWVYKTRTAIARTLQNLDGGITHVIFRCYALMFLRITHTISRYQEFAADALAASTEGGRIFASGLKKIYSTSFAYDCFWRDEMLPALDAGFLPPYINGFQHFLRCGMVQAVMEAREEEAATAKDTDIYATHPPLWARLQAVENLGVRDGSEHADTPAITLIENLPLLERTLFASICSADGNRLRPIVWDNVGEKIYLPLWTGITEKYRAAINGVTIEAIRDIAGEPGEFVRKLAETGKRSLSEQEAIRLARFALGAAVTVALARQGWRINALPGELVQVTDQGKKFMPFDAINKLFAGKLTILAWRELCRELGISKVLLAV